MSSTQSTSAGWTFRKQTGEQRAAVAVWQLSEIGSAIPSELVQLGLPPNLDDRVRLISFGAEPAEDCVCVRTSPASIELQTHGGTAVADRVRELLQTAGGSEVAVDSFDDECWDAVSQASTSTVAKHLAQLADGQLKTTLERLRASSPTDAVAGLELLSQNTEKARRLVPGASVSIAGLPNAGKSSLLNRIVGFERSITDPRPGATRDIVRFETAIGGYPVSLSDTAGRRTSENPIETEGVRRAEADAAAADLIVLVIDRSEPLTSAGHQLLEQYAESGLVVAHKSDRVDRSGVDWPPGAIAVSSTTGDGVDELLQAIDRRLSVRRPARDAVFFLSARQAKLGAGLCRMMPSDGTRVSAMWDELLCCT